MSVRENFCMSARVTECQCERAARQIWSPKMSEFFQLPSIRAVRFWTQQLPWSLDLLPSDARDLQDHNSSREYSQS